jgi:hypothetical protein
LLERVRQLLGALALEPVEVAEELEQQALERVVIARPTASDRSIHAARSATIWNF